MDKKYFKKYIMSESEWDFICNNKSRFTSMKLIMFFIFLIVVAIILIYIVLLKIKKLTKLI